MVASHRAADGRLRRLTCTPPATTFVGGATTAGCCCPGLVPTDEIDAAIDDVWALVPRPDEWDVSDDATSEHRLATFRGTQPSTPISPDRRAAVHPGTRTQPSWRPIELKMEGSLADGPA